MSGSNKTKLQEVIKFFECEKNALSNIFGSKTREFLIQDISWFYQNYPELICTIVRTKNPCHLYDGCQSQEIFEPVENRFEKESANCTFLLDEKRKEVLRLLQYVLCNSSDLMNEILGTTYLSGYEEFIKLTKGSSVWHNKDDVLTLFNCWKEVCSGSESKKGTIIRSLIKSFSLFSEKYGQEHILKFIQMLSKSSKSYDSSFNIFNSINEQMVERIGLLETYRLCSKSPEEIFEIFDAIVGKHILKPDEEVKTNEKIVVKSVSNLKSLGFFDPCFKTEMMRYLGFEFSACDSEILVLADINVKETDVPYVKKFLTVWNESSMSRCGFNLQEFKFFYFLFLSKFRSGIRDYGCDSFVPASGKLTDFANVVLLYSVIRYNPLIKNPAAICSTVLNDTDSYDKFERNITDYTKQKIKVALERMNAIQKRGRREIINAPGKRDDCHRRVDECLTYVADNLAISINSASKKLTALKTLDSYEVNRFFEDTCNDDIVTFAISVLEYITTNPLYPRRIVVEGLQKACLAREECFVEFIKTIGELTSKRPTSYEDRSKLLVEIKTACYKVINSGYKGRSWLKLFIESLISIFSNYLGDGTYETSIDGVFSQLRGVICDNIVRYDDNCCGRFVVTRSGLELLKATCDSNSSDENSFPQCDDINTLPIVCDKNFAFPNNSNKPTSLSSDIPLVPELASEKPLFPNTNVEPASTFHKSECVSSSDIEIKPFRFSDEPTAISFPITHNEHIPTESSKPGRISNVGRACSS